MQFQYNKNMTSLQGVQIGTVQIASKKQVAKLSQAIGKGICTMMLIEQLVLLLGTFVKNIELT